MFSNPRTFLRFENTKRKTSKNAFHEKNPSARCQFVAECGPPRDDQNSRTISELSKRSKKQTSIFFLHNGIFHNCVRQDTTEIHVPPSGLKTRKDRKTSKNAIPEKDPSARCQDEGPKNELDELDGEIRSRPTCARAHSHFRRLRTGQPSPEGLSGVRRP